MTFSYTTSAIPFVNAQPHIGHAFELVLADALARHQRRRGLAVRLLAGTDDHSLKNARAAAAAGIDTATLVARNGAQFRRLAGVLGYSLDDYLHTSQDPRHAPGVAQLWRACRARGDIYRRRYQGLYCVGCEAFLGDDELAGGRCPTHQSAPELVEEENEFFRLSRYGDALLQLIDSGALEIVPDERRNEVRRFIAGGLHDFSISRSRERARGWGLVVPDDPSQIVYVWFDALAHYVTAAGYGSDDAAFAARWQGADRRLHVIGKDIVRFHAVYWPAILLSAGLAPPTRIAVHGFLTVDGQKIGKSAGNGVDPFELANIYGVDALRYYLLRHLHSTRDGDFSRERLVAAHDDELADQLGNLVRRVLTLIERHQGGVVVAPGPFGDEEAALAAQAAASAGDVAAACDDFALHGAVAAVWRLVAAANRYADRTAPWTLARAVTAGSASTGSTGSTGSAGSTAAVRLATVLYCLAEALRLIAVESAPFIPGAAARIAAQLGLDDVRTAAGWGHFPVGTRVRPGPVLFPKLRR
jgi:methionyl-tRNA synthetase